MILPRIWNEALLLSELFDNPKLPKIKISGLCLDSRKLEKGDLFFAFKGYALDGNDFVHDALEKGAQLLTGARRQGLMLQPTILVDVEQRASFDPAGFQTPNMDVF